ncbi:DNA-3-methyladenine glycosylase [Actinoplanes sp. N902-109]|uniref:DNA-3-methyladenine glycosylase family protein n=1 Tax=Actinoplanes sp. (strain N902-109) TaxID=649831 RepID=UPI0003293CE6|nr:DNA-3-methyladenine glycosylase [Actinoplanes sp. N902-109]AGL18328.1 HhH-GPD family protein [Actinoplanes sp. N902-109]
MSDINPRGTFQLSRSIGFLEQWSATRLPAEDAVLRFAFCRESDGQPVGVSVTQDAVVRVRSTGPDVTAEVARILSLDVDGTPLDEIAHRDPVVAELAGAAPGLRPVCFWTAWEAAVWAVLSQRTSRRTAAGLKRRIGEELGTPVPVDGRTLIAFPSPQTVLTAGTLPGVNPVRTERLHALARAALDGLLTAPALRALPVADALSTLRSLPGVGPFSAALILIRGAGAPDVFTMDEPRTLAAIRDAYGLPGDAGESAYRTIADGWHPLRSWVSFLLRAHA